LLEEAVSLLELSDLGFFGEREAVTLALFDLGSLEPPLHARRRYPEVPGDLADRGLSFPGDRDDVAAELLGERFRASISSFL
jgi:hypothetical protein